MQGIIKTGASGSGSLFFLFDASVLISAHSGSSEFSGMEVWGIRVCMSMETDEASPPAGKSPESSVEAWIPICEDMRLSVIRTFFSILSKISDDFRIFLSKIRVHGCFSNTKHVGQPFLTAFCRWNHPLSRVFIIAFIRQTS